MAKETYKIPTTLDAGYVDLEFNLQSKDGVGLRKPVNGKTILTGLIIIIGWIYFMFKSPVGSGGLFIAVGFTIVWLLFGILMIKVDETHRHGFEVVPSMLNYLPKRTRSASVRLFDDLSNIQRITGVESVDVEDGLVHFMDGTMGYVIQVVGSASILMFDKDKEAILQKVDTFYRKLPVGVEIIYDTVRESQRTHHQIQSSIDGYRQLKRKSPGLRTLYKERHDVLKDGVGDKFKSTHQYAILKAPKEESLSEGLNLIFGDVEGEALMFKRAKILDKREVAQYLKYFYGE